MMRSVEVGGAPGEWLRRGIPPLAPGVADMRRHILAVGAAMAGHVDAPVARVVRDVVANVRAFAPRIAVIGQMKAGKSSVASAFIARPWLLPSNVNPWTTVVTRLHFDHPSGRTHGATYTFFSEQEWRRLSEDGGQLRVVGRRLMPDLDIDVFRAQLTEARVRAERRLGDDFAHLLGSSHSFDMVSSEQIAAYVTAGDDIGAGGIGGGGRVLSDITRSADIYFDATPFDIPVTLVDTPGTNDPFLVRDEITLRCLEDVDLAVVVLSARQALTTADMALLRTMAGLRKDRIAVFINRCDELEDIAEDSARLAAHVGRLLLAEFGHAIPVVTGSALLANSALAYEGSALPVLLSGRLQRHVEALGLAGAGEMRAWCAEPATAPPRRAAEILHAASGLPALRAVLSRQLEEGAFGDWIRQIHGLLGGVCVEQERAARHDLQLLEERVSRVHYDIMTAGLESQRLQAAARRLESASARLERIAAERTTEIGHVQQRGLERLRASLLARIEAYVERERAAYMQILDRHQASTRPLRLDVSRLRRELETAYLAEYRALHRDIVQIQLGAVHSFRRALSEELPRNDIELSVEAVSGSFTYPSLGALGRVNAFDIDPKLWTRWRRTYTSLSAAIEAFEALLRQEFSAIAGHLVEAAEREIGGPASMLRRQLEICIMQATRSVRHRHDEVKARLARLVEANSGETQLNDHLDRLGGARDRLTTLQRLSHLLVPVPVAAADTADQLRQPVGVT